MTAVTISRKATTKPVSARTGVAGALLTTSTACPAGLTLCSATGLVPTGPGLGAGAGVISGKSPAAFPAPTRVVLKGLTAFPGPMSELVALFRFGSGPSGEALADGPGEAELVVRGLAVADPGPVVLAPGVGLDEAEGVGLDEAEGVGLDEAEDVGLAVGAGDVEGAELVLGVGAGDVESVGLGVDVGGGDVEGAGLSLVLGAGVEGDGLGVAEALGPGLVLAAAGEEEGEESAALANAGSCQLADSPMTRKPPVTSPAITARPCAVDM